MHGRLSHRRYLLRDDRDALIAEAQKRIADKPGDYYPRVYGLKEVAGLRC
jgi:hypothetical protein